MIDPEDIEEPSGYCRLTDIPRSIEGNAKSDAPWGIRRGPVPSELFGPTKKVVLLEQAVQLRSPNTKRQRELFRLIESGLVSGALPAAGLLFDEFHPNGRLVQLTPAHWRIPQTSVYAPLEGSRAPFEWAMSVQMIRLLPELAASPVVLPLVSEAELAIFLDAEDPPSASDAPVTAWTTWQSEFRTELAAGRKAKTRAGGRPTDPVQNKAMWHEVVRRAMAGELAGMALSKVTRAIHEWMTVKFLEPQDETTVRRQLDGLFPKRGTARAATRKGR